MKRRIYFRADAGKERGYGHFIRTLALADMLKDDFDCVFVTQAPTDYQKAEVAKVCQLVELPATDEKFRLFLDMLQGNEIVVLDNYFYDTEYQRAVKAKGCKLVCIDDMHDKHYVADVVINHGLSDENLFDVEPYTRLCLGLRWALLRKPFYKSLIPSTHGSSNSPLRIVLCFGGVDPYNLTNLFIHIILQCEKNCEITAIIGDGYVPISDLQSSKHILYLKNISAEYMASLLSSCNLAILPASTICLEALSCHAKVAAGYYVDNQKYIYEELVSKNKVVPLGDLKDISNKTMSLDDILRASKSLKAEDNLTDIPFRYQKFFHDLFDMNDYKVGNYHFVDYRNLDKEAHKAIWIARNDASVRRWMDNPNSISWKEHWGFVKSLFHSDEKTYWGVYEKGILIGSVNIKWMEHGKVERGIFVVPLYANQSKGSAIEQSLFQILKQKGVKEIFAKVLCENVRSVHFHAKRGYRQVGSDERYVYFEKNLNDE